MVERPKIGSLLNHYRIVSLIGAGGMGEVYLAEDTRLGRRVAVKILPEDVNRDKTRLQRFEQEARAASALNHPNILTVFEFGDEKGLHFLATEFIEGKTLRDEINGGELSIAAALSIAEQVAFALSAAHSAGIVHRDLKPENIMVRSDGIVKVLDFGLAKLLQDGVGQTDPEAATRALVRTDPGAVMGTAAYMSPEQVKGKEADARTDIWSLGAVLYETLTGKMPFTGENSNEVIASILKSEPLSVSAFVPVIPHDVEKIVGKTLRKDREERYQNVKDLWLDLKDVKQDVEIAAKLERSTAPDRTSSISTAYAIAPISTGDKLNSPTGVVQETTSAGSVVRTASSAEYLVSEIKSHKRGMLIGLGMLIVALVAGGWWLYRNASPSGEQITSIAVLPFENGSGDPNLDYLSDGLSETLIDKLSELPQLKVIARNSSFRYRGSDLDLQDVANKLGVRAIVTGKVARVGDNINVRVEMVDATENRQLWSEQYNRNAADLLSVQQDIAQTASDKLRLKLSGAQEQQLAKPGTTVPQAYELVLKGRFYDNKGGTENRKQANEYFQQAVAADPNYALAYAELAESYAGIAASSEVNQKEYLSKADIAAHRALELDENLPNTHIALGFIYLHAWDWTAAEKEYKRAIELNANLPDAHRSYAAFLSRMCRHDEAIAEAMRGRELDPLSLESNRVLGYRLYQARKYDESIKVFQKIIEMDPNYDAAYGIMGYAYTAKHQFKEAIDAYKEAIRLGDKSTSVQVYLGEAYVGNGEREKAQAILKQLQTTKEYVSPGELAVLYGALGDKDAAFASLEKAYSEHDLQLQFLKVDPSYDRLRDDPRYQDLMRRVGLPL